MVPKSKGGTDTTDVCKQCHKQVHALFTNNELKSKYHTVDLLKQHPEMGKYLEWVKDKPIEENYRTKQSKRIKRRR